MSLGRFSSVFENYYYYSIVYYRGRDSSVSTATGYGLDGPGIDSLTANKEIV
jgi:hypothetical protein